MKDYFSEQSDSYAQFRPSYPEEFFTYLDQLLPTKNNAWDCGTGNGQVAIRLAKMFENVFATDISQAQINNAFQAKNIHYSLQTAEKTNFTEQIFDLIVAAQAVHWFDFERFYAEVRRTAKKNALLVLIGYGRVQILEPIDKIIDNFYFNVLGQYWDKERKYIDEHYQTIPFPFEELQTPTFTHTYTWSLEHLIGYLGTWSAVKKFRKQKGYNPLKQLRTQIEEIFDTQKSFEVHFPILLRIGRVRN
ncbi:MAG: class I SAM-dependent methyltransferase [Raineya sp.]